MVDVLVYGSLVFTGSEVIREGYVYIKNGRIVEYGEQPTPEDYTYAALVLGGEGRIIAPGLTAVIASITYPFRYKRLGVDDRLRIYKSISREDSVKLSLPAIHEAHLHGVTTVVVEALDPSIPKTLEELIGGSYALASPSCPGKRPPETPPGVVGVVTIRSGECSEGDIVEGDDGFGYLGGERVLAFLARHTLSPANIGEAYRASNNLRRAMGLDDSRIEKGRVAELAVFDATKPPGFLLDRAGEGVADTLYSAGVRAETIIVGDHVLVDGGEHLYIVEKHFREARRTALRLLEAITK